MELMDYPEPDLMQVPISDRLREVIAGAHREAARLDRGYVDTEHMVLAQTETGECTRERSARLRNAALA